MAKGIAQRRRVKRALEAARGNLHKIANGKALPTALPEAPKPKDVEKLPASLRKMLALKEVAAKKDAKGRKAGDGSASSDAPATKAAKKAAKGGAAEGDDDGPSTSGRDAVAGAAQQQQQQRQTSGGKGGSGGGVVVKGANAFTELFVEKKLKDKKKDYLKRKAEQKRHKGGPGGGQLVVEKELQLRDKVKFGEVVHAPLQVHLKRKHWADKEKTANERCKEVFLKQMQQAQQRMAGGAAAAADDEGIALRRAGGSGAGAGKGSVGGGGAGPKNRKRKAPMDEETEELRQRVIESYRAAKKDGGFHNAAVGHATMSSLSHLVGKGGSAKAAAAAGGGGRTHTLA
ncbi:hypothetical protein PLESTB_001240900 [Pleodorina starrii]|uniref:Uncharacterized protein n=1 Tax=Pleodorina starrii TaxID=330485 RepID=A0A9W6BSS2_9CHLO|nr:hypothetical protein PLESTM_000218900 [Pleodorina starrii]GLC57564.1 hypothetical protein PLESTB_001240900 [Pleodorina starrii]GLC63233.1 hypothetical protein PLESTF_000014600 [Pleodorina starrii]